VDNDCDGEIDEDVDLEWYVDADGDGFGVNGDPILSCESIVGRADNPLDCDDADALVSPDAIEVCDEIDNDCDGSADVGAADTTIFYLDLDGDGYGQSEETIESCAPVAGFAEADGDCDDAEFNVNPSVAEICDGVDNNCDLVIDEDSADDAVYRARMAGQGC
jgi:hypothetical protein